MPELRSSVLRRDGRRTLRIIRNLEIEQEDDSMTFQCQTGTLLKRPTEEPSSSLKECTKYDLLLTVDQG